MGGLKRIAKMYGGIKVSSQDHSVRYVYDYANDEAVPESQMPMGSDRWKASEAAKWGEIKKKGGTVSLHDVIGKLPKKRQKEIAKMAEEMISALNSPKDEGK